MPSERETGRRMDAISPLVQDLEECKANRFAYFRRPGELSGREMWAPHSPDGLVVLRLPGLLLRGRPGPPELRAEVDLGLGNTRARTRRVNAKFRELEAKGDEELDVLGGGMNNSGMEEEDEGDTLARELGRLVRDRPIDNAEDARLAELRGVADIPELTPGEVAEEDENGGADVIGVGVRERLGVVVDLNARPVAGAKMRSRPLEGAVGEGSELLPGPRVGELGDIRKASCVREPNAPPCPVNRPAAGRL